MLSCKLYHHPFFLLGDFNLDPSITGFNVVQEPTRVISSNKATLIDLVLASNVNYIQEFPSLANSDHNSVSLAIKQETCQVLSKTTDLEVLSS